MRRSQAASGTCWRVTRRFSRADASRFFGREREAEDLSNRLRATGLVAVVASQILSSRPPTGRPVAVFVGCDSVEWREGLREALRATLPDIEPPRGGDSPS